MSPVRRLAAHIPPTPRIRTTVCALSVTALSASVGEALFWMHGAAFTPIQLLLSAIIFTAGVLLLHVGHCAEARDKTERV